MWILTNIGIVQSVSVRKRASNIGHADNRFGGEMMRARLVLLLAGAILLICEQVGWSQDFQSCSVGQIGTPPTDMGPVQAGCSGQACGPDFRGFGEFLYLRPSNERVAFAVPINGAIVPPTGVAPVQLGIESDVDCSFDAGFRAGFACKLDECTEIVATYTHLECDTTDEADYSTPGMPPFVLRSLVNHPGTQAAPTDFLQADARLDLDYQLADLECGMLLWGDHKTRVDLSAGIRYCHLDQFFNSNFSNSTTTEQVSSSIRFDGGGVRLGADGEWKVGCRGLMVYGRTAASFVGGEFRGRYDQTNSLRGNVVTAGMNEDAIISIVDLELGIGWTGKGDHFRVTGGYAFSGWFNTVNTDEFIQAVQTNNSVSVGDSLGFDGLVARAELRF